MRDSFRKEGGGNAASIPDPRIANLVRFLARRAAEKDFERLLAEHETHKNKKQEPNQP